MKPFATLDYTALYQKGFTESGADSLNLTVQGRHAHTLRSQVGLSAMRSFKMGHEGCFAPKVWISGINEATLIKHHYIANFEGEMPTYQVRTFNKPIYLVSPGCDLSFTWGYGLGFSLRYSAEVNHSIIAHKFDSRLEWFF